MLQCEEERTSSHLVQVCNFLHLPSKLLPPPSPVHANTHAHIPYLTDRGHTYCSLKITLLLIPLQNKAVLCFFICCLRYIYKKLNCSTKDVSLRTSSHIPLSKTFMFPNKKKLKQVYRKLRTRERDLL
uniref:Uncharacterized protein n=1 Tax=Sphaerodactylus townsendi TaxID=933632 RepID=A0ACB8EY90_9SAUR